MFKSIIENKLILGLIVVLVLVILAVIVISGSDKTQTSPKIPSSVITATVLPTKKEVVTVMTVTPVPTETVVPQVTLNPTDIEEVSKQAKSDGEMKNALDSYSRQTPLLYLMPVTGNTFKIDYLGDGKYQIILLGEDKLAARQDALNWWKSYNIEISTLDIVWE